MGSLGAWDKNCRYRSVYLRELVEGDLASEVGDEGRTTLLESMQRMGSRANEKKDSSKHALQLLLGCDYNFSARILKAKTR
jgi:hypothetical protein